MLVLRPVSFSRHYNSLFINRTPLTNCFLGLSLCFFCSLQYSWKLQLTWHVQKLDSYSSNNNQGGLEKGQLEFFVKIIAYGRGGWGKFQQCAGQPAVYKLKLLYLTVQTLNLTSQCIDTQIGRNKTNLKDAINSPDDCTQNIFINILNCFLKLCIQDNNNDYTDTLK